VHRVDTHESFLLLLLSVTLSPLCVEDTENFGFKHSLEYHLTHSWCQTILHIICKTGKFIFINNIVGICAKAAHKVMLISDGIKWAFKIRETIKFRFNPLYQGSCFLLNHNLLRFYLLFIVLTIRYEPSMMNRLSLNNTLRPLLRRSILLHHECLMNKILLIYIHGRSLFVLYS
jgi:hypothetical protein